MCVCQKLICFFVPKYCISCSTVLLNFANCLLGWFGLYTIHSYFVCKVERTGLETTFACLDNDALFMFCVCNLLWQSRE